ncbi:DUF4181 domain-containing protein [Sporosarcina ureilytica]|uniref:DUF4181 domain-containing protein n=1 Tax=Sporosarcina ureilytica TaxID=298596 RepID=A0A1D8JHE1_9BACL|nr:DUF4181 domain-containing protein [Sporosarcina ureilytica]AOV08129.1 hypothetical protein BI350_11655 [Sporosarcina ureilytica]
MGFVLFFIIIFIISVPLDRLLNKLFKVEKKKISDTSGKKIDQWGRGIITVIFLCGLIYVIYTEVEWNVARWYFISLVIAQNGLQFILEWKYLKSTNQYIVTLIYLLIGSVLIYNMENLIGLF